MVALELWGFKVLGPCKGFGFRASVFFFFGGGGGG